MELCVNAVTTETVDSNLTDLVLRELRYEVSIMPIVSQAYSYVRRMSVSGIIENIVRHHLSLYEEDFEAWRKL